MIFSLFKILKPMYSFPPSTSIKSQFAKSGNSCLISLPTSSTPPHYCYLGGGNKTIMSLTVSNQIWISIVRMKMPNTCFGLQHKALLN